MFALAILLFFTSLFRFFLNYNRGDYTVNTFYDPKHKKDQHLEIRGFQKNFSYSDPLRKIQSTVDALDDIKRINKINSANQEF